MAQYQFKKVKLYALGEKTAKNETVDVPFFVDIYNSEVSQNENFNIASKDEIERFSQDGRVYYAIENEKSEIVGATAMQYERSKIKPMWKRGYVGRTHIIPKFRGNGYSGSSKIALREIIKEQGFHALHTYIKRKNKSSIKANLKVGFRYDFFRTLGSIDFNFFDKRYRSESLKGNWYEVYTWKFD